MIGKEESRETPKDDQKRLKFITLQYLKSKIWDIDSVIDGSSSVCHRTEFYYRRVTT